MGMCDRGAGAAPRNNAVRQDASPAACGGASRGRLPAALFVDPGRVVLSVALAAWSLTAVPAPAQPPPAGPARTQTSTTAAGLPVARAHRVARGPEIDGDVLGEAVWTAAGPQTGFRQNTPDEGEPASERTEVRIVYTDDTIYFGVVCFVGDPATIIVSDARRDSSLTETDSFRIVLDTYRDQQNGFVFGTNPAGLEYDGQLTNEGEGSGGIGGGLVQRSGSQQQRGSGGGFNLNWDGVWQVAAQVTDVGWTAEFAIPFRTLRYASGAVQTWGLNFQRNIRHRNEESYWAPLPRQFNLNRLSLAGELQGVEAPPPRNLKLNPYLLGQALRRDADREATLLGDVGADLKYSVTPSLTLDLSYNTDFAQVEVDDQQINLDRFNLFFPEKRPFFLENAGLFSVGQPGELELFFSRRIGIGDDRTRVPIRGGGRLTGQVGSSTNIGLLNMQTAPVAANGTPSNNYTVARVRQDLPNRSNVGAMVVNRRATGELADAGDVNRSYAVDGRWGIGEAVTMSGFAAATETPGVHGGTHAYNVAASYESERYRYGGGFTEVAPGFNPEVGFYARRGYRRVDGAFRTAFRPENAIGFHEWTPHAAVFLIRDFDTGQVESDWIHLDNTMEWRNGFWASAALNLTTEGVLEPFEIFPEVVVPADRYDHAEAQLRFRTDQGAPLSLEFFSVLGGFFGGRRTQLGPRLSLRLGERFNTQVSWERNDLDLPGDAFVTNLARLRLNYSFTPRVFVQALAQYNDRARLWSSNVRFGMLSDANTGLFIVYDDIEGFDRFRPLGAGRSLTVKYSHLLDLLN